MAICKEEAFVLKRFPLRETSLVATLFGRSAGKIKILMKGIRKEKNPRMAAFEPFSYISVVYYEKTKSDLHLGSDVGIIDSHSELRSRLDLLGYASYMTELIDSLFGFHDPHEKVFDLLGLSFQLLNRFSPFLVTRVFELKLLRQIGWLPLLGHCASCGKQGLGRIFFSPRHGGIICAHCNRREPYAISISNGTLQSLLYFRDHSVEEAVRLQIGKQTKKELERIGDTFIKFHLGYPLRSLKFLSELKLPAFMPSKVTI